MPGKTFNSEQASSQAAKRPPSDPPSKRTARLFKSFNSQLRKSPARIRGLNNE